MSQNRTEALDASRQVIRDRKILLPRGGRTIQELASHLAADVKQLVENEDTGARVFRYLRTGTNHYSLAFTYDCIAWSRGGPCLITVPDFDEDEQMASSILTVDL